MKITPFECMLVLATVGIFLALLLPILTLRNSPEQWRADMEACKALNLSYSLNRQREVQCELPEVK